MQRVKFGWITPLIGLPQTGGVPIVVTQEAAILPEVARRFDSIWIYDHLFGFDRLDDPFLECWTTLTWLAARYPTLQIGPLVLAAGLRHPAMLAHMGASLHALTSGRLVLGLGMGWRAEEFHAWNIPFPPSSKRIIQLEEVVTVVRRMWTEEAPAIDGEFYRIPSGRLAPKPGAGVPIMVGGNGEKRLIPLAARLADWWNGLCLGKIDSNVRQDYGDSIDDPATLVRKRDVLFRHADAAGRDPASIVLSLTLLDQQIPLSREASERWLTWLTPFVDAGVTHFMLDFGIVDSTEPIVRFAEDVIAPLNQG